MKIILDLITMESVFVDPNLNLKDAASALMAALPTDWKRLKMNKDVDQASLIPNNEKKDELSANLGKFINDGASKLSGVEIANVLSSSGGEVANRLAANPYLREILNDRISGRLRDRLDDWEI